MLPFSLLLMIFMLVLTLLAMQLGRAMAPLARGQMTGRWQAIDARLLALAGIRNEGMNWRQYALAVLVFNVLGAVALYAVQRLQGGLPLNPQAFAGVESGSAFNTAISFVTNTNWQGYGGESTMSYLSQMLGLTVQNFLSAATGIAVAFALMRGFAREASADLGNFWADVLRVSLYVLLPLSTVLALAFVSQGVLQNLSGYLTYQSLAGHEQTLAMGPVASQEAIKLLGTNGGGFFNANSAHPFENPTELANFLQMLAIFLIPAALTVTFGQLARQPRQGWVIYLAMSVMFIGAAYAVMAAELQGNPILTALGVADSGNFEGKEMRFGLAATSLFIAVTTSASCGAVNAMHDSLTALGGMIPMWLMQLGEVVFGGVGSGLYGMLVFAVLAVFVAGLMVGRTPEYLGKKIEAFDMKMVALVILVTPTLVLAGTAASVLLAPGLAGLANPGAHGLSEILYAFTSAANNNGSAFAGLSANTPYYNAMLGIAMWFGRFAVIVPVLALAGSLARKKTLAQGAGTMPTDNGLFIGLLIGSLLLVGALTYVPALALGPVAEHFAIWAGR